ncbi:hypothetical protein Nepgr_021352 [Nepenthes gracilis]|uniref:Uncharacterized protein n=1 Tax=Nepenthes gracilis TaxID=150966 RepID=A0AAD3SYW4_NEPGR|nr:hypothetical protein Nepgr_021352 [Nepenthes gracilis]
MATSRALTICTAILVCSLFIEAVHSHVPDIKAVIDGSGSRRKLGTIGYGGLKGGSNRCPAGQNCEESPANHYNRGCEASQRCHHG